MAALVFAREKTGGITTQTRAMSRQRLRMADLRRAGLYQHRVTTEACICGDEGLGEKGDSPGTPAFIRSCAPLPLLIGSSTKGNSQGWWGTRRKIGRASCRE